MAELERLTVTLPAEMAASVETAVSAGDYASASEVVRAALRDWQTKRAAKLDDLSLLRADIAHGLADIAAGRVENFDVARIIERGRKISAGRSPSD